MKIVIFYLILLPYFFIGKPFLEQVINISSIDFSPERGCKSAFASQEKGHSFGTFSQKLQPSNLFPCKQKKRTWGRSDPVTCCCRAEKLRDT